jgi:hypothetical protein
LPGGEIVKKLITVLVCFLVFSGMNLLPGQTKAEPQNKRTAITAEALSPANEAELRSVRDQLFKFLRMSPRLTMAISTDPSLLSFPEYVNKHNPGLADFIQGHPEIARNPEFYLFAHLPRGGGQSVPYLFQRAVWPEVGPGPNQKDDGIFIMFVFLGVICAILWLLRLLLQNRRWNRIFKVQTEIHTKLLDRLSGNQELFAYLGSDAGRKLMELAPITTDINSRTAAGSSGAASRILAPLQFGIVAALAGCGMLFVRGYLPDSAAALLLVGTLALMLGVGLIFSAGISWVLLRRLGQASDDAAAN